MNLGLEICLYNKVSSCGIPIAISLPIYTPKGYFCWYISHWFGIEKVDCIDPDSMLMKFSVSVLMFGTTKTSMAPGITEQTIIAIFSIAYDCFYALMHRFPICHFF